jgi:dUTP pyrophosphatase
MTVHLKCKKLHPDAVLPAKAHSDDIGWDICCVADYAFYKILSKHDGFDNVYQRSDINIGDFVYYLEPGMSHLFHTGFACAIDTGNAMLLWDRSGLSANKNIHRLAGVIDATYRGEWMVSLINLSRITHIIKAGDKIIQGILTKVLHGVVGWVDELPVSFRNEAGFGSTGN